jgi:hypothetical protein
VNVRVDPEVEKRLRQLGESKPAGATINVDGLELALNLERHTKPLLAWAQRTFGELKRIKPGAVRCALCTQERKDTPAEWFVAGANGNAGGLCDRHVAVMAARTRSQAPKLAGSIKTKGRRRR